jgi:hypothetical protein
MFTKKFRLLGVPLLVVLVLAVMVGTVAAATVIQGTVIPFSTDPRDPGPSGQGTLRIEEDGVHYNIHTMNLDPGSAITNWAVVFNDPNNCIGPCDGSDIEAGRGDASVFWAAGAIVPNNSSGAANFAAFIPEGDPEARGVELRFGKGLVNSETSEVHIVIRTHGPAALDDPDLLMRQLNYFDGGCDMLQCDDQQAVPFFLP